MLTCALRTLVEEFKVEIIFTRKRKIMFPLSYYAFMI